MSEYLFEKGEKVVVKEQYRDYVKNIYSDAFFHLEKRKLGAAASKGTEMTVIISESARLVVENKKISNANLSLHPNLFEPIEEDIDVSDFFE